MPAILFNYLANKLIKIDKRERYKMDFSDYLKHTRNFYGLTLVEFGEHINFSPAYINEIERKRKTASDKFKTAVLREFPRTDAFDRFLMEIKRGDFNGS